MKKQTPPTVGRLILYAGPALPMSMLLMPPIFYIPPFYATEMNISMTAIGFIFFLARFWDALIDPLVGSMSDQTRSRWGRRKPWIALGSLPLLVATYFLLQPPPKVTSTYLMITIFVFYLAWTMVQIPYLSWGAEFSTDYRTRNRVVGYREAGTLIGILVATGVPTLVFFGREPSIREILLVFVITVSVLLPITVFMALRSVPDQAEDIPQKISLNNAFKSLTSNKPLMQFIASTFLMWLGVYILNASIIFILEKLLNFSGLDFLKMVFLQFLIGTLITPVIVKLANRFGKHQVLAGAAILTAVSCCALSFARPSQPTDVVLFFAAIGFFITPIWVLPTALVADLVDLGALLGGGKKEGLYMALYNLALKLAVAASVGIALPLMSRLGFDPSQALTVNGQHALTLVGLYLPATLLAIGSVLMFLYPLDAKTHAEIVSSLAAIRVPASNASMVSSE